jgi:hypothetical protein
MKRRVRSPSGPAVLDQTDATTGVLTDSKERTNLRFMKKLTFLLAFLSFAVTGIQAQRYTATKGSNNDDDPNHHLSSGTRHAPATHRPPYKLKKGPVETGVIYEMTEHGFRVIDPGAPPEAGNGEAFLTSNPFPSQGASTPGNEAKRDFGGIKLYGWEF